MTTTKRTKSKPKPKKRGRAPLPMTTQRAIIKYYKDGFEAKSIAREFKICIPTLYNVLSRNGVSTRRVAPVLDLLGGDDDND